jgi:hypothetical protein
MVENGGFPLPAPAEVGEIRFVPIKPDEDVVATDLTFEIKDEVWNGLVKVLQFYRDEASGFTARRAMTKMADASRYDHLSRFGEWELSEPARARRVGFGDDE